MRALRDFNIPKIVTDDIPVFMGLIGDLFPSIDVPRKRSSDFEKLIRKSAIELNLEAEDGFVLKVICNFITRRLYSTTTTTNIIHSIPSRFFFLLRFFFIFNFVNFHMKIDCSIRGIAGRTSFGFYCG